MTDIGSVAFHSSTIYHGKGNPDHENLFAGNAVKKEGGETNEEGWGETSNLESV